MKLIATVMLSGLVLCAGDVSPALKAIHKIYIDKLPNELDQYLRAEFFKQMSGKVSIVLREGRRRDPDRNQR